jgi:hypothetical protein
VRFLLFQTIKYIDIMSFINSLFGFQQRQQQYPFSSHSGLEDCDSEFDNEPVKTCKCFKIVIVLDESGSMQSIKSDMIESLNSFIREQKQMKDRPCHITLVKFNDKIKRVIKNEKLAKVSELETCDYKPAGTTALFDAIGDTVNWFRYEKNVLMVVITDGHENSSRKYNKRQITDTLDEKKKNRGWSYVYLANDLSTAGQGAGLGMNKSSWSSNCTVPQKDYGKFIKMDLNEAVMGFRNDPSQTVQSQLNTKY